MTWLVGLGATRAELHLAFKVYSLWVTHTSNTYISPFLNLLHPLPTYNFLRFLTANMLVLHSTSQLIRCTFQSRCGWKKPIRIKLIGRYLYKNDHGDNEIITLSSLMCFLRAHKTITLTSTESLRYVFGCFYNSATQTVICLLYDWTVV